MAALLLWTAPAAYYLASLILLAPHEAALLVWLVALMLAGGIASVAFAVGAGIVVWVAVTVPLLLWSVQHTGAPWLVPGLAATARHLRDRTRRATARDSRGRTDRPG